MTPIGNLFLKRDLGFKERPFLRRSKNVAMHDLMVDWYKIFTLMSEEEEEEEWLSFFLVTKFASLWAPYWLGAKQICYAICHVRIDTATTTLRSQRKPHDVSNMVRQVHYLLYSSFYQSVITHYTTTKILHQSPNKSPSHMLTISSTYPFTKPPPKILYSTPNLNQQCLNLILVESWKPNQDLNMIHI